MAEELIYTSAEKGLRAGTSGFSTVAHTRGMRQDAIQLLESLSAYRASNPVSRNHSAQNPVTYSHYRFTLGGENISVLSRIAPLAADHTQRANKIAHHVVLRDHELPEAGPAWLARQPGFFITSWNESPRVIEEPKEIPQGNSEGTYAASWDETAGDAGWAGVLAQAFETAPRNPAYIVFEPHIELLPLLEEAAALVRPKHRWRITFNTFFQQVPPHTTCLWRCCRPEEDALRRIRGRREYLVIDLRNPGTCSKRSSLVRCAREGTGLENVYRAASPSHGNRTKPQDNKTSAERKDQPPGSTNRRI